MEVFLLEVGLSPLQVPPDVDLLVLLYMSLDVLLLLEVVVFEQVSSLLLDVLLLLEVVAFGWALSVLLPMLPVFPLVAMEVYLKG